MSDLRGVRREAEDASDRVVQAHAPVLEVARARWSRRNGETVEVPRANPVVMERARQSARFRRWASRNGGGLLDEVALGTAVWLREGGHWELAHTAGLIRGEPELPVGEEELRAVHLSGARVERSCAAPAGGPWRLVLVPLPESAVAALWLEHASDVAPPMLEAGPAWSSLPVGALAPEATALARLVDQLPGARTSGDLAARAALRGRIERLAWRLEALSGGPFPRIGDGRRLDEQLEDLKLLVQRRIPDGVVLDWRVPGGLPAPMLTGRMLRSLVLELVENAGRALSERGSRLRLRAGEMEVEEQELWRGTALSPGGWLWLEVADDGPGIDEDGGDVFQAGVGADPSLQTAGLGLTAVEAAMQQLGGAVRLHSAPGRGTIVQLAIPVAD